MYRVESRTKLLINRVIFSPYTHEQVKEILEERLSALSLSAFDSKAREFVARKASSTAGDLRAALKICQNTIELYREYILKSTTESKLSGGYNNQSNTTTKIFSIVNAAVSKYKETPFISMVSRTSPLEKAILLCFCKHRKIVCGGDDHSSLAGMTALMAWSRFEDLMQKIAGDDFFRNSSNSITSISSFSDLSDTNKINLRCPPFYIFQQTLSKLESTGILMTTTSFRPCGRPVVYYHVSSSLLYSDFVAAMTNDPLYRFVSI